MNTHKDLDVWKLSIDLVEKIYSITNQFPAQEKYGLNNQLQRSAVSVPSNIAEGAARSSDKDYIRFLYISLGSLSELETQLIIAERIKYLKSLEILEDIKQIRKKLLNLIKYLKDNT